jgi:hypothetical protein
LRLRLGGEEVVEGEWVSHRLLPLAGSCFR